MGQSQTKQQTFLGYEITVGELIVIFLLLILGWIVILSWGFLFETYVLRKLRTFGGLLGLVIVISGLYLSISLASGNFAFLGEFIV